MLRQLLSTELVLQAVLLFTQPKKGSRTGKKLNITLDNMTGFTTPGTGQAMMSPQDQATWTWNAFRNTATQNGVAPTFSHPQFGTGSTPVVPDYLLVGGATGVTEALTWQQKKLTIMFLILVSLFTRSYQQTNQVQIGMMQLPV